MFSVKHSLRIAPRGVLGVAVMAALAGCTQAPFGAKPAFVGTGHEISQQANRRVAETRISTANRSAEPRNAGVGLASFYDEGSMTASGENFSPRALTAAHPTLPFGTRLRVTNVSNGRSVVVRVNDRGPFVAGRVVDVSRSAAESLDMVGRGIAKVKIDVIQ